MVKIPGEAITAPGTLPGHESCRLSFLDSGLDEESFALRGAHGLDPVRAIGECDALPNTVGEVYGGDEAEVEGEVGESRGGRKSKRAAW